MIGTDLLTRPCSKAAHLGQPIPESRHAVSMALPTWSDVIGYEEQDPRVVECIKVGYPRFLIHPEIRSLAEKYSAGQPALPFPSRKTAKECADYVQRKAGAACDVLKAEGFFLAVTSEPGRQALEKFWQHAGTGLSTRAAAAALAGNIVPQDGGETVAELKSRLAQWYDCSPENVYIYSSGMAAFYAAHKATQTRAGGGPTLQLGFPYVDSLKVQQEFGSEAVLLHQLDELPSRLATALEQKQFAACFMEIPGNPMLGTPELRPLIPLLCKHSVPLVVDDTVATSYNVDLRNRADIIVTSLTKFPAGSGDVLGGALIVRPEGRYADRLQQAVQADFEELIWPGDARIVVENSKTFAERMRQHNSNGKYLAERLREHPAVAKVYYPIWEQADAYDALRREQGGYGALISILLHEAEKQSPRLYDALDLCKGPSLGTIYTLVCPFALLAHYRELDWAEACGVSRYLIRFSVGLEPAEQTWQKVSDALDQL